jgi:hypothetical protein
VVRYQSQDAGSAGKPRSKASIGKLGGALTLLITTAIMR